MAEPPTAELEGELIAAELVLTENLEGDDQQDSDLLRRMGEDARRYIASFTWCETILASFFGGGIGGIFAVFFFHIRPSRADIGPWVWIMVGDVPAAYLPVADCKSALDAFEMYVRGMRKWVELARQGRKGTAEQGVPPVNVPATREWAERLDQRLQIIEFAVRPFFKGESGSVH